MGLYIDNTPEGINRHLKPQPTGHAVHGEATVRAGDTKAIVTARIAAGSALGNRALTTFQGQLRLRLREFLHRVRIDASTWSDERLDELFNTYLVAYEAA